METVCLGEPDECDGGLWGGPGEVGRAPRCSLACDRGWRGVAPSVAVFHFSFSLGTSAREVSAVLDVMCECLQNRECVERKNKKKRRKKTE